MRRTQNVTLRDGLGFATIIALRSGKRRIKLSKTSGWTIHDLRRTVRSELAELGVPKIAARKVLNYEKREFDRIYNRHEYLNEK